MELESKKESTNNKMGTEIANDVFDKKIPAEIFKTCIDNNALQISPVKVDWHGVELEIKPILSFYEMIGFVNLVAECCFSSDTNEYLPEMKDFGINCGILALYTNLELPDDIEDRYEYVLRCDAFSLILEVIDEIQFKQIITAIDAKIKILAESNINALQKEVSELYGMVDSLSAQMESLFGEFNSENINSMLSFINSGNLDEKALMDAYLKGRKNERS